MASSLVASLLGGEVTGNHSKLLLLFKASTKKKHLKLLFSLRNQYFKKNLLSITAGALQNHVSEVVAMFRQADVILSCSLTRSIALEPRKEQVTRILSGETKLSSHFSNFL